MISDVTLVADLWTTARWSLLKCIGDTRDSRVHWSELRVGLLVRFKHGRLNLFQKLLREFHAEDQPITTAEPNLRCSPPSPHRFGSVGVEPGRKVQVGNKSEADQPTTKRPHFRELVEVVRVVIKTANDTHDMREDPALASRLHRSH